MYDIAHFISLKYLSLSSYGTKTIWGYETNILGADENPN